MRDIASVHRMVMENRPADPGSIQGSHRLLWILCDTLARWLEAVSSTLVEMVTLARKLPGRQEVLPCCGEDVVDIEHWRLGGQHTQINRRVCTAEYAGAQTTVVSQR